MPFKVQLFKEEAPGIKLPPEPIITRWGTWLHAASYYCKNLENIRNIFEKLSEKSTAILEVKKLLTYRQ